MERGGVLSLENSPGGGYRGGGGDSRGVRRTFSRGGVVLNVNATF